ncbi:MAG: DUF4352 domain-containing protein [Acidobacteriota bacterium]|jgi:hypothetical protein|nr:DUF4352 domain-containing protein [Bryobacteraceae bacterium CoA2 C42]
MKIVPLRYLPILSLALLLAVGLSCSSEGSKSTVASFSLGDRAPAGRVTYVGLTAEYRAELPGAKEPVKHRYLLIFLSATNGSGQEITLPHTRLIGANGTEYPEVTEIDGFPQWLGLLRTVSPGSTEQGYVVFDVPVGAYKLQVSSGGDPEKEQLAEIEIPANLRSTSPTGVDGPSLSK